MLLEFQTIFQASPISWIQYIWDGQVGGEWGAEGRFFHTFEQKSGHCTFIEVHRQSQLTCQGGKLADSSLTPY